MRSACQIVSGHYAASARGDLTAMMAEVAPDLKWAEMAGFPCAGTHIGKAQVVDKVFKALGAELDGDRFELETLIAAGDCIVGIGTSRATGKATEARDAYVWCFEGGPVRQFGQFTDASTLQIAASRWVWPSMP